MSSVEAVNVGNQMLLMSIYLGAPIIVAGMIVGLVISIIQTITQIQEQSIAFVAKVVASVIAFVMTAPWMLRKLMDFTIYYLSHLDKFVR